MAGYRIIMSTKNRVPQPHQVVSFGGQDFAIFDTDDMTFVHGANALIHSGSAAGVLSIDVTRPQAIFFDMDATVIAEESLVEISKAANKEKEIAALTDKAMAGGMDFAESLRLRLKILKGLEREKVMSVVPHINSGMVELSQYCIRSGIKLFLVSGGFVDLAAPVARQLGFADFRANRFVWDGDCLAGSVEDPIVDADGKLNAVLSWCSQYGLDPKKCIAVGDGANDLKMMQVCGAAVGFVPKKILWPHLAVNNQIGDHRLLLALIGDLGVPSC